MRTRRLFVVGLLGLSAAACGRKKSEVKPLAESEGRDGKTSCSLPASGVLEKDAVVSTGCTVVVPRTLVVKNGAKLVVEPGATLAFDLGAGLVVEKGVLLARGSDASPVVFTSHAATKSPGNWLGITFADDGAGGGSTLLHATVEYAGGAPLVAAGGVGDAGSAEAGAPTHFAIAGGPVPYVVPTQGAILLAEGARSVTLEEVRIAHAAAPGVVVRSPASLASFRAVVDEDVPTAVVVPAQTLGMLTGSSLAPGVVVFGNVTTSTSWPKLGAPIHVAEQLVVDSGDKKSPAVLDLGEGNELYLAPGVGIDVGNVTSKKGAGALVARKVHFAAASGKPGDEWTTLALYDAPAGTVIDGCTFEHGGGSPGGPFGPIGSLGFERAVLLLPSNEKGVVVRHNVFRDNVAAAMSGGGESCHGHEAKSEGNVSIGQPLCWEDPFALAFGGAPIGLIGTLESGSSSGVLGGNVFGSDVGDAYGAGGLGMTGVGQGGGGSGASIGLGNVGGFGKGGGGGSGKPGTAGGEIKPVEKKPAPQPTKQSDAKSP